MKFDKKLFDPTKPHGIDDIKHVVQPFPVSKRVNDHFMRKWNESNTELPNTGYIPYSNEYWSFTKNYEETHWRFFRILDDIGFARMTEIMSEYSARYGVEDKDELIRVRSIFYRMRNVLKIRKLIGSYALDEKQLKQGRRACEFFYFPWCTKKQKMDAIKRYSTIGGYKITKTMKKELEREFKLKNPKKARKKLKKQARVNDAYNQETHEIAEHRKKKRRSKKRQKREVEKQVDRLSSQGEKVRFPCTSCGDVKQVTTAHLVMYRKTFDKQYIEKPFFGIDLNSNFNKKDIMDLFKSCKCGCNTWTRFPLPGTNETEVEKLVLKNALTKDAFLDVITIPVEEALEELKNCIVFNPDNIKALEAKNPTRSNNQS